ncbi:hypothetical protein BDN70DRAFT_883061 [Pholiota conissans]|uniref:Uncharacterized protein n=1 Tax=Pholiota conissans TaxID=109636 RepID=A0A9P5YUB1_9AGAR|nr:hypothetical protein BDN70DRAFT_883061 [Pholiota conissans]
MAAPLTFLPHVSAIAAFLIILRVANGRTLSTTKQTSAFGDSVGPNNRSQELTALQFAPAVSIISAQEPSPIPSEEIDFGGAVIASHTEAV